MSDTIHLSADDVHPTEETALRELTETLYPSHLRDALRAVLDTIRGGEGVTIARTYDWLDREGDAA